MLSGCPDAVKIFEAIVEFAETHAGRPPERSYVASMFPNMDVPEVEPDRLLDLIEDVRRKFAAGRLTQIMERTVEIANTGNIQEAVEYLVRSGVILSGEANHRSSDLILEHELAEQVIGQYEINKTQQGLLGIPWPWDIMNVHTQGILDGKYYVIWGVQKSMKTWLALYLAMHIYENTDEKVLLYLREMTELEVLERLGVIKARVSAYRYQKGTLTDEEELRLRTSLLEMESEASLNPSRSRLILMRCPRGEHASVKDIAAKVRSWGAKLVVADSAYLMANDQQKRRRSVDWKNVGEISGGFADLAHDENIKVIVTTQENERELKKLGPVGGASVGYTRKFLMDADMAIHILRFHDRNIISETFPQGEPEIGMTFIGRGFEVPAFTIRAVPAESFEFKRRGIRKMDAAQKEEEEGMTHGSMRIGQISIRGLGGFMYGGSNEETPTA